MSQGQSLYRDLGLPLPGKAAEAAGSSLSPILFIYGGSTAMGIAGIQFAKLSGAVVIATASPRNFEYLRSLGADHVVDYHSASLVDDVRQLAGGRGNIRLAWDCRPSTESATVCADVLADDPGADARYSALLTDTDAVVCERNPAVATFVTLAYSALGEDWFYGQRFPPNLEDHEFLKFFMDMSTELLAQGKLKPPRIYLNEGGKGLEGLLHGIQLSRTWAVSAGKLVYTLE
jgi:NADPH:quinone reductase-like Zn-dependent oxidoreductase